MAKKERNILRKILDPAKTPDGEGEYRLRSNQQLYQNRERLSDTIRNRRLKCYGHIVRMDEVRLKKEIFNYEHRNKVGNQWLKAIQQDMQQIRILDEIAQYR